MCFWKPCGGMRTGCLRMAKATLADDPRPRLLGEIARRYRRLNALPCTDRPSAGTRRSDEPPGYTALMIEIRDLVDQYKAITTA
jgi:hypothetical protein